uniref:Ribosomal protein L11 n=1 Tax=Pteridomonas sp. YPF1301 TaxID=2766739 RepID=A0A7G1MQH2_9STRA|nr:ribosomal protein L11 [Pteridomonas sp. YPF1301]
MIKKKIAYLKLELKAGNATPLPPIGPALGQYGIDIASFCKEYNNKTKNLDQTIIPIVITIFIDKSYSFILKTPPTTKLLLQAINVSKGSIEPKKKIIGSISNIELEKIAKIKLPDFNTTNIKKIIKSILGTAKNMGINLKTQC